MHIASHMQEHIKSIDDYNLSLVSLCITFAVTIVFFLAKN
jgi:hypothetical protein